jgi:hypothetical protein
MPARRALAVALLALMALPSAMPAQAGDDGASAHRTPVLSQASPLAETPPDAVWREVDALSARVDVPPAGMRVLRINATSDGLEPVDWPGLTDGLGASSVEAVATVEPWLRHDLAANLGRLEGSADRFAREVRDCTDTRWRDEVAFSVAHTPPEVLRGVATGVLTDNARQLYEQDQHVPYADLVERTGPDGNFTTMAYTNLTYARWELPRDVYYYYLAHARVFWETPAKVGGRSLWRKAFFNELSYGSSGTLKDALSSCTNLVEAVQTATTWNQRLTEFGYGTNLVQPVEIVQDGYGSCGEYSITAAAAMKAAMVPARVSIYAAEDHQWDEFWLDGNWTFVDASNDDAGASTTVREPERIPNTGTVNLNDPATFERSGWKPFMAGVDSFRPDEVLINSVDIVNEQPAFGFGGGSWTPSSAPSPHKYTHTAHVHVSVVDGQGDPVEGAWVGVYRVGHNIYNTAQHRYPTFAISNYTNATGRCDLELGLQGYCSICGESHAYATDIYSWYGDKPLERIDMEVPRENEDFYFTYTVDGDAPDLGQPAWAVGPAPADAQTRLTVGLDAWGLQRHRHGEFGGSEVFASGAGFDHEFGATVDVAVVDQEGLDDLAAGRTAGAVAGFRDATSVGATVQLPPGKDLYLVLMNRDTSISTKAVEVELRLEALTYPRVALTSPIGGIDRSTAEPLEVRGTVRDHIAITGLEATLDGADWTDLLAASYDPATGALNASLDVAALPSGERTLRVRATDAAGIWREASSTLCLDALDPVITLVRPRSGDVLPATDTIAVEGSVRDDRGVVTFHARLVGRPWTNPTVAQGTGAFQDGLPTHGEVGPVTFEAEAIDASGRATRVRFPITLDPMPPVLEVREPAPGRAHAIGAVTEVRISGSALDEYGVGDLMYSVDDGPWVGSIASLRQDGSFELRVPVEAWVDGPHTVHVRAVDLAGYSDYKDVSIVLDTTPPTLVLDRLLPEYSDSATVELRGTVTDPRGVKLVTVQVDAEAPAGLTVDSLGQVLCPLPSGSASIGVHTVIVKAADELDNAIGLTLSYAVVDTTRPRVAIDEPLDGARATWGHELRVSGTAKDNVGVASVSLNVGDKGFENITRHMDPRLGTWEVTVATADLPIGSLTVEVRVRDAAGNDATEEVLIELVDGTSPTVVLTTPPGGMPRALSGQTLVVPGTAMDDVGVKLVSYRVDGGAWVPVSGALVGRALNVTVLTQGLTAGMHLLDVKVQDAAGNSAIAKASFEVAEPPVKAGIPTYVMAAVAVVAVMAALVAIMLLRRRGRPSEASAPAPAPPRPGPSRPSPPRPGPPRPGLPRPRPHCRGWRRAHPAGGGQGLDPNCGAVRR